MLPKFIILKHLNKVEYNKIDPDILNAIEKNRNEEYVFELDDNQELSSQEISVEARAILYNLFRDYLSTPEQKEKILIWQKEEGEKEETKKRELYNTKDMFAKNIAEKSIEEPAKEQLELVEYKEDGIFKKFFKKIKEFFRGV